MLVTWNNRTIGRVRTTVWNRFQATDRVADTTLAVGAGAILVCGTKVKKIGEDDAKDGERRETQAK